MNFLKNQLFHFGRFYFIDTFTRKNKLLNDKAIDGLSAVSTGNLGWWIIGGKDSSYLIRQLFAGVFHISRFTTTLGYSATDIVFSKLANKLMPNSTIFNDAAATQRFYTRLMMTLRLNGGVYEEIHQFIAKSLLSLPPNAKIAALTAITTSYPVCKKSNHLTLNEYPVSTIKELFRKQTGYDFFNIFREISATLSASPSIIKRDGVLRNGIPVTITIIPPNVDRMRKIDLIPFRLLQIPLNILPFMKIQRDLYNSFINRFSWNISKEISARMKLIEKLGIDPESNFEEIVAQVERLNLPVTIPVPNTELSGDNILVTSRQPPAISQLPITKSIGYNLTEFFSSMFFRHSVVVPNIDKSNILFGNGKIALERYHPITDFDKDDLMNIILMTSAVSSKQQPLAERCATALCYNIHTIQRSAMEGNTGMAFKEVLKHHTPQMFAFAEGLTGISGIRNQTNSNWPVVPFASRLVGSGISAFIYQQFFKRYFRVDVP
ncbi:hypothetical protein TVAG_450060 [Trichomonas vaginalis G3]|uniref:Uncharacterized protein n=1 Tax=Trichomonas vaginalis (strain ATCC PRA-98 / G3) TaxID=412133 RepID=A2G998_TRIV3|nr:regulation of tocopherol cyclase protein [Trichomonas vaginalis G3]EAX86274.1 hypothetical protein TVAG_450060 [Trichomonas vaginalis G3]KAI5484891.1 regulation of tocopherol cyclase protein [Trichomonas vaginalis G3]|eukprot:XP_001299204.1 hypothetical protein [Trichomonas vaginalis G3]